MGNNSSWNDFCNNVRDIADKAGKKAGQIADVTSLRIKLKSLEIKENDEYKKLGKVTYDVVRYGSAKEEESAKIVKRIDSLKAEQEDISIRIEAIKEEERAEKAARKAEREAKKGNEKPEEFKPSLRRDPEYEEEEIG